MKELYQTADWKKEKHVPVIEVADQLKKNEPTKIIVSVGKEIAHPNTTEHHISWIRLFYLPEGEKFPYQIGEISFDSHGSSVEGANTSTVYCEPHTTFLFKTGKSGKLISTSYCNIHGLWKDEKKITVK
jgi:superoxide reductase